jgi:hypothetical protein
MVLVLAAIQLLTESAKALKALLELLRFRREEEGHPARRSPPKHLKKGGRRR